MLFQAEWKKVSGNRWLSCCFVWIFPFFALALITIILLISIFNPDSDLDSLNWSDMGLLAWVIQSSPYARPFLLAFAAAMFASEYEHRTWKAVIPGNRRIWLILNKYLALTAFITFAFFIMMMILVLGAGLIAFIVGADYEPDLSMETFSEFAQDLALNVVLALVSTLIVCSIAALLAIFTRSVLIGVVGGMFFVLLETFGIAIVLVLAAELIWKGFNDVFLLTPFYNTLNITTWINDNTASQGLEPEDSLTLVESILVLGTWLFGLMGLTIFIFQRQDIQ
jgi:ABC-type transport system involved in multi-copper enzyme maturation permease subunit